MWEWYRWQDRQTLVNTIHEKHLRKQPNVLSSTTTTTASVSASLVERGRVCTDDAHVAAVGRHGSCGGGENSVLVVVRGHAAEALEHVVAAAHDSAGIGNPEAMCPQVMERLIDGGAADEDRPLGSAVAGGIGGYADVIPPRRDPRDARAAALAPFAEALEQIAALLLLRRTPSAAGRRHPPKPSRLNLEFKRTERRRRSPWVAYGSVGRRGAGYIYLDLGMEANPPRTTPNSAGAEADCGGDDRRRGFLALPGLGNEPMIVWTAQKRQKKSPLYVPYYGPSLIRIPQPRNRLYNISQLLNPKPYNISQP